MGSCPTENHSSARLSPVAVPAFDERGVLPPSGDGEPYSVAPHEFVDRFGFTEDRRRAALGLLSVRGIIDYLLADADGVSPATIWVKGPFLTTAQDVETVDALLLLPSNAMPKNPHKQKLIEMLCDGTATRSTFATRLELLKLDDSAIVARERTRCARATPVTGGELLEAGWVTIL